MSGLCSRCAVLDCSCYLAGWATAVSGLTEVGRTGSCHLLGMGCEGSVAHRRMGCAVMMQKG